jgi:hypothetical protein
MKKFACLLLSMAEQNFCGQIGVVLLIVLKLMKLVTFDVIVELVQ